MEEITNLIRSCFENKMYDEQSRKKIKTLGKKLKNDDINFLIKTAFDFFRKSQYSGEGLFMIDCLEKICNTLNDLRSHSQFVPKIYFSPVEDCSKGLSEFIDSAKQKLLICVFTISDDRISQNILNKHRSGVQVKIITDNEKQFDKGSDILYFANEGIEIKVDTNQYHMHHKFAIADNTYLLTGSFNWTRSAANFNQENIIILSDEYAVKRYSNEFERLWRVSAWLRTH